MQTISMLMGKGFLSKLTDFVLGFVAFIPQTIYFFYASIASLLDVLQYLVRKLAGLDVYYVNGQAQGGDIVTDFLKGIIGIDSSPAYSALSTVFWSLVIFGVILLILTSIVAIIKAHYNYDANKANPFTILRGALKSLATMVIVPIVSIFGVYLMQILLVTVDEITSPTASTSISSTFEADAVNKFASDDDGTYTNYDYFSAGGYTTTSTFSGMMFKIAAYDCNRVRSGYYTAVTSSSTNLWDNMGVFYAASGSSNAHEVIAAQIDYAFCNNLKLKDKYGHVSVLGKSESAALSSSLFFGISATFSGGLYNVASFSKFNVGLVWYFYDLWTFNSILGFAGIIMTAVSLGNIIFGLMGRLLQVVAMFVVYPAFIGIMPLDDGNAFGQWRKQFTSDILMSIGAIVGMNVFFLILPMFETLSFFNNTFIDAIVNMIVALAGLTLVKKFIGFISKAVGGGDANESGGSIRSDVTQSAMKGLSGALKAGNLGAKVGGLQIKGITTAGGALGKAVGGSIGKSVQKKKIVNALNEADKKKRKYKDLSEADIARGKLLIQDKVAKTAQDKADKKYNKRYGRDVGSDEDIAKFFNKGKSDVNAENREAYDKYYQLDQKERDAIMDGAVERDDEGKVKKDADGHSTRLTGEALEKYLNSQLGVKGADAKAQAAWINHKGASTYRRATKMGRLFGQDTSKYKATTATVDKEGNVHVEQGTKTLKGFGQATLDLGDTLTKTATSLSGLSKAWDTLAKGGVIDEAKTAIQSLTGMHPTDSHLKSFLTGKQKTGRESDDLKQMRKDQLDKLKENATQTKEVAELLESLNKTLKDMSESKKSGPGTSGGSGSGDGH